MCSGSTIYCSLKESGLKPGDWAVFPGAGGGVGHMGVQLAKAMGMRVVGVDGGDEKRELCMKLGCEAFVDFTKVNDVAEEVVKICDNKGAHGIFVTATSGSAYASAPMMARIGGKIMCIGLRGCLDIIHCLKLTGSSTRRHCIRWSRPTTHGRQESARYRNESWITVRHNESTRVRRQGMSMPAKTINVLHLTCSQGQLKPIYEVFPLAKMPDAVEKLRSGKVAGRLVVDFNS
jgi:propanol-preferring alcohol dehydrogenase